MEPSILYSPSYVDAWYTLQMPGPRSTAGINFGQVKVGETFFVGWKCIRRRTVGATGYERTVLEKRVTWLGRHVIAQVYGPKTAVGWNPLDAKGGLKGLS
jgi:hypothetical protein